MSNQDGSHICVSGAETLDRSTGVSGKARWIAFQQASLARIFRVLAQAEELKGHEAGSSGNCFGSSTTLNRQLSSWKTRHESEPKGGGKSLGHLWREDIPGKTERLRPIMLEQDINAIAGGALLPTLTVSGNWNRKGASQNSGDGLATAMRLLPTLLKSDGGRGPVMKQRTNCGGPNLHTAMRTLWKQSLQQETIQDVSGGFRLTPEFAEWWMGWPIRWTASKCVETGKSRCKRR